MAVEDFLPIDDAKQTIEKEVKPRPSVDELTTVESPGKPVPATFLLMKKKVKNEETKEIKVLEKKEPAKIEAPKRDAILIITEKPQAAQKIAFALGAPRTKTDLGVSYYELQRDGNIILVASAVGHLFNLEYKEGQRGWPIFEVEWRPSYEKKGSAFTKKYYDSLKKLARRAKEVIVASVDYNEKTPVVEDGKFKLIKIGDLVENIKSGKKEVGDYLIPSFNEQGIIKWNKLKNAISHKIKEELYEISLEYGRKVRLTSSHNLFKLKGSKIVLAKTTGLKVGESILCPSFLPTPEALVESLSLLDLTKTEKKRDIYVAGKDVAKILQKRVINKIRKNSPLNEKRFILTQKGVDKIKNMRLLMGYSTQQIANLAQISQASISLWENGLKNPTESKFNKYLSTLQIGKDFIENPSYCKIEESSFENVLKNNYLAQYKEFSNLDRATIPLHELTEKEIREIKDGVIYGSKNKRSNLPINLKITKELVRLIGYYLAEGDINENYRIRFSLGLEGHGHEKKIIEEIREFCDNYNLQLHTYLHNKIKHQIVTLDNTVLALLFKDILNFGKKANEKTIPSLIFHLSKELKLECLRALFLGDGSLSERCITFNTASEKLAADISYLLMQLGIIAGISKSVHKTSKGGEIMWRVVVSNSKDLQKCKVIWSDHHNAKKMVEAKSSKNSKEKYGDLIPLKIKGIKEVSSSTESVYDLSVEGENFIVGMGGVCCHNTDYDVEGEVIGWNVVRFILNRNDAKRMKFSTLTKNELLNSFTNPMNEIDWNQAYAGETRHVLDWLYGINLSRALMSAIKTAGSFKILSIGRVQGPALKIIVDREREIINFKSEPYWNVYALVDGFSYKHPKDIFDKKELEKFNGVERGFAETKDKKENVEPPHPFDLTTLQREAYRLYKINPSQTLAIAQKLYLDGLISYPRTSSQKIPFSIEPQKILKDLEKYYPEAKNAKKVKPVEGDKLDPAHPSIYPTGEYSALRENEKKIYDLIVKRFISVFSDDAIVLYTKTNIIAENDPEKNFTASGLKIEEKGWTAVYPSTFEESSIPRLNDEVKIDEIKTEEKETQPPRRYTPTSLITILEKKNLGTKSTRSIIVDILFNRGYLDGQSIKATPLGMKLIESLEKYSPIIVDENLTRQLEDEMEKISETKSERAVLEKKEEEIIAKARKLIEDISKEFRAHEIEIGRDILGGLENLREEQRESNIIMPCRTCGKGNLRILFNKNSRRNFVACSSYPECKQTYTLPPNSLIKKSDKNCVECGFPKLLSIRKGRRPWEFCFNPECETNKKRLEEWKARQGNKEDNNAQ